MAHTLYEFLRDSVLAHPEHVADGFTRLSDDELGKELLAYREHVHRGWPALMAELREAGALRTYFDHFEEETPSEERIRRAALYFDLLVLPDPLYAAAKPPNSLQGAYDDLMGMRRLQWPDRESVVQAIRYLVLVRPLVAGKVAKVIPVSKLYERGDKIPMLYSETGFYELVPPQLLQVFRRWSEVWPLRQVENGWISGGDIPNDPCRAISVQFRRHTCGMIYTLMERELISMDEATGKAQFFDSMPDKPPSQEQFDRWVDESINRSAWVALERISAGVRVASEAGAFISTTSPLVDEVLQAAAPQADRSIAAETSSVAMQLSLPVLDDLSLETLVRLREDHGESFASYRTTVTRGLRRAAGGDPGEVGASLRELQHELMECQLPEVEREVARLRRSLFQDVAIAAAGVALTVPTSGWSLAATFAAGAKLAKTLASQNDSLSRMPAHFLWEAGRTLK